MTLKPLSHESTLTFGVAAGVVVVVFWAGVKLGQFESYMTAGAGVDAKHDAAIAALVTTATDHEVRLASQERSRVDANHH